MAGFMATARKLQRALNAKDQKILINTSEFYSMDTNRPVKIYAIKQGVWDEEKHRTQNVELFSSASLVQIVLFLRDYWYELNGMELPHDNPIWEEKKQQTLSKKSVYERSK